MARGSVLILWPSINVVLIFVEVMKKGDSATSEIFLIDALLVVLKYLPHGIVL